MTSPVEPSPRRPWLAIGVVLALAIVALNLAGYLWYRANQEPPTPVAQPELREEPAPDAEEPTSARALALDQREAGIKALKGELYDRAIVLLEAAQRLDPETPDIEALLDLARKMGGREELGAPPVVAKIEAPKPPEPKPEPKVTPERTERRSSRRTSRRASPRRRTPRPSPPAEEPALPQTGELFVTTVPDDLLIEIDGRPSALSPARVQLPPGEHTVRLRQGPRVLMERKVTLTAGSPATLEADVRKQLAEATEPPQAAPSPGLGSDPSLDLVALVEREGERRGGSEATTARTRVAPASPPGTDTSPPTAEGGGRFVVVWSGSTRRDLSRALRAEMGSVPVEVVSSLSKGDLAGVGAVMGSPGVLRGLGLSPNLRAASAETRPHVAVSLKSRPSRSKVSGQPVGILDRLGARRTSLFVGHLLGTESPPPTRRVGKVEDLLSLLQLGVVDTVLVERSLLPQLAERTQQDLFTLDLEPSSRALAVGFVVGADRGGAIASALQSLSNEMRQALGMRTWTQ